MYNPDSTAAMKLLGLSHMHAHADEADDSSSDTTFKLRVAAIFVILVAGLLGKCSWSLGYFLGSHIAAAGHHQQQMQAATAVDHASTIC
jgi:hypothetical protein